MRRRACAGRHPESTTGGNSLLRDHLVPGPAAADGAGEHIQDLARIRAGRHLSVTARRMTANRVLQVTTRTSRTRTTSFIPAVEPTVLRRQHEPRDGHREHHGREDFGGDAAAIRRAVAACAASRRWPSRWGIGFIDKIKQETHGEVVAATGTSSGYRWTCTTARNATNRGLGPGWNQRTTRSRHSPIFWSAIRRWARPTSRSISLGFEKLRCSWRDCSGSATCRSGTCSIAMNSCGLQSSGLAVYMAQQDDQAQQGTCSNASATRDGAAGKLAHLLKPGQNLPESGLSLSASASGTSSSDFWRSRPAARCNLSTSTR